MNQKIKALLLFPVILFSSEVLLAQKNFTATIQFPSQLDKQKILLHYDNGREQKPIKPTFNDDQITIYNTIFPDSLKQTPEGAEIAKIMRGINLRKNQQAPDLLATDVQGKMISLDEYRGRYVLINFWASWCGPCIEEMPTIIAMRKQYSEDKLEMIFITLDKDSTAFSKAVEKHNINGTHIFANDNLIKTYGAQAIPKGYLIDTEGMIVYNRDEEGDYQLKKLSQILKEKL